MGERNKLAVIGDPIGHSLSPLLHNTMARELNLPYDYTARQVTVEQLPDWVQTVRREDWSGFNATMPHKLHLLDLVDEKTEDRLKYSMTVQLVNDDDSLARRKIDKKRLINSLYVKPSVPLFITYYTIYYGNDGRLVDYNDVYGYDEALAEKLGPYVE